MEETVNGQERVIGGVFRRLAAFLIDSLLFGLVGQGLGLVFEARLIRLGSFGIVVGFAIAVLYFGVMNSRLANGQTLGKRLCGVRVVGSDGNTISLKRSLCRAMMMGFIVSQGSIFAWSSQMVEPAGFIGVVGLIATVYLFIFNRKTRQLVHDLFCATYVYKADAGERSAAQRTERKQYIACVLVAGVIMAAMHWYGESVASKVNMKALSAMRNQIQTMDGVYNVSCLEQTTSVYDGNSGAFAGRAIKSLQVTAFTTKPERAGELRTEIAKTILETYPDLSEFKMVSICVGQGYTIGFASRYRTEVSNDSPEKLRAYVRGQ